MSLTTYYNKVSNKMTMDEFRVAVLNMMEYEGLTEEYACIRIVQQNLVDTALLCNLKDLDATAKNKNVQITVSLRHVHNAKEVKQQNTLHAVFSDATDFVLVKFHGDEINQLVPYAIGTTFKIKGVYTQLPDGTHYISKLINFVYESEEPLQHNIKMIHELKASEYYDTYLRILKINRSTTKRPHVLLVEDERNVYIIKTWQQVVDVLEENTCYHMRSLQKSTKQQYVQYQFNNWSQYKVLETELSTHIHTYRISQLEGYTLTTGSLHNIEARLTDIGTIQYNHEGEANSATKYVLCTDETTENTVEFVDWQNAYADVFAKVEINDYVQFDYCKLIKRQKPNTYNIYTTEFCYISRK